MRTAAHTPPAPRMAWQGSERNDFAPHPTTNTTNTAAAATECTCITRTHARSATSSSSTHRANECSSGPLLRRHDARIDAAALQGRDQPLNRPVLALAVVGTGHELRARWCGSRRGCCSCLCLGAGQCSKQLLRREGENVSDAQGRPNTERKTRRHQQESSQDPGRNGGCQYARHTTKQQAMRTSDPTHSPPSAASASAVRMKGCTTDAEPALGAARTVSATRTSTARCSCLRICAHRGARQSKTLQSMCPCERGCVHARERRWRRAVLMCARGGMAARRIFAPLSARSGRAGGRQAHLPPLHIDGCHPAPQCRQLRPVAPRRHQQPPRHD